MRITSSITIALLLASCSGGSSTPGPTVVAPTPTPAPTPAPSPTPSPSPTPTANDPNPLPVPVGPVLALSNDVVILGDSLAKNLQTEFQAQVSSNVDLRFFPSSSESRTDYLAYSGKARTVVIWTGHNTFRTPDQVATDVNAIATAIGHGRYIVLGLVFEDLPSERIGGDARAAKIRTNELLAAAHGDKFIDTPALLTAWANPNNAQDRADVAAGVTPSTLRFDPIHLRRDSGERVLMNGIRTVLTVKGW